MSESLSGVPALNIDSNSASVSGTINNANTDDIFRVRVAKAATVAFKLQGLTGDATLELVRDSNNNNKLDSGEVIARSAQLGTRDESISRLLDAGFYFVRVSQSTRGQVAKYKLTGNVQVFATSDVKDSVANDSSQATKVDPKPTTDLTLTEYVGGNDPSDWYRWDVKKATSASIRLNGLQFDANVTVYQDLNHNGKADPNEAIATTTGKTGADKVITGRLNAGTYFFGITAVNPTKPTTYSLRLCPSGLTSSLPLLSAKV
ncbi:MAG TPA: pre-peptidase C-terminal domain-containing protein [Tepidisphaeraceae bacterium]|nr:pre-peptidase C-terminal domain-containing protein [Tepidisphaeraceae bacterium]